MGVVGCILGFLVVIYLCYKDWSVYIASIVGAAVVIAFNVLPFMDTLLDSYVNGMFVPIKSFFFLLLFGSIQSKIYSESGAAFSIADTIMSKLLRPGASNTKKNVIAVAVIVAIGIILCMGGINASVFIVLMYPVALTIFEYCDIPKRFILGVLAAASYTFTLTMPGSPQVTNVAAMTALGTAADVALVPGLVGAAVEVIVIIVLMNIYINKARAKGEHFELHPLDPHYDKNTPRPNFWIALIPLVALFVSFNILKININICVIGSTVLSILLFWKQLKAKNLRELISTGAADSIHMSLTVAAICGFAGVVTNTEAFTTMLNAITSINMSPMLICAVVVAVMCMIVGGVGVMNIMLVSITERTREIGVRMALGAKRRTIRMQFVIEAIMLCLIGGIIGILIGVGVGALLGQAAKFVIANMYSEYSNYIIMQVHPSATAILLSLFFSMLTGVFFGYYPANKASKMEVIDALRYE